MDYEALWIVLSDLITDLRKAGEDLPAHIIRDLRSAKTLIEILKVTPSSSELPAKIEECLGSVEAHLIPIAHRRFGSQYADEWTKKLMNVRKGIHKAKVKHTTRFISGLPRDKYWIRIKVSRDLSYERVKALAGNKLHVILQEDGYMLIYGDKDDVKAFIKELACSLRGND